MISCLGAEKGSYMQHVILRDQEDVNYCGMPCKDVRGVMLGNVCAKANHFQHLDQPVIEVPHI